jgi:GT2 family glycosyltransferase
MISIVIPVYNQHEMTNLCLKSILDNISDAQKAEIIIIDNGSVPRLNPKVDNTCIMPSIRNEYNLGFPVAVNQGIRASKGDIIILLNNDVIVTPGWIYLISEWLNRYDIVAPMTNYCAGIQRCMVDNYYNESDLYDTALKFSNDNKGKSVSVNYVIGFCMAFRRSLYDELGEFDESLWPCSGEEIDFCLRAKALGHQIGIVQDIYVHHFGSQTFKEMQSAGQLDYAAVCERNDRYLASRHGGDFWQKQLA